MHQSVSCPMLEIFRVALSMGSGCKQEPRHEQYKEFEETEPTASSAASGSTGTKKRKAAHGSANSSDRKKIFDFTKEYRELKKHLACTAHKDSFALFQMWTATIIELMQSMHPFGQKKSLFLESVGNATSIKPPENIMFQDFFLPAPKRTRNPRFESTTNPCAPTIHVTVNTGSSAVGNSSPPRQSPLSTITAASANANNIDFPSSLYHSQSHTLDDEISSSRLIRYPPVTEILQQIDDCGIFADSAVLDFPAIIFADELERSPITHVDHVVNMPVEVAKLFVKESIAAMGRAQGKGRM
ncbi:hypothetical protein B0H19DRAFT_1070164 [Mycena capillaripes]|nr:hypothetical protein B0H19DRAFT_1070164 [Mycena capillaripes]